MKEQIEQKIEELRKAIEDPFKGNTSYERITYALKEAIFYGQDIKTDEVREKYQTLIDGMEKILQDCVERRDIKALQEYKAIFNPQISLLKDLLLEKPQFKK